MKTSRLLFILPIVIATIVILYFFRLHDTTMINLIQRQYYEKIELTTNLLKKVERLHRKCTNNERDILFNNFIITAVEEMDKQYGIYGRVIDLNGNVLSKPYLADGEPDLAIFFEVDDLLPFLKQIPKGDSLLISRNNVKVHLHWLRYPIEEQHYYYILLGIVYDRVIDTIDYNAFARGFIVVILAMLVSMFYTIFILNKYAPTIIKKPKNNDKTNERNIRGN